LNAAGNDWLAARVLASLPIELPHDSRQ
jgi:hypothetical protein